MEFTHKKNTVISNIKYANQIKTTIQICNCCDKKKGERTEGIFSFIQQPGNP